MEAASHHCSASMRCADGDQNGHYVRGINSPRIHRLHALRTSVGCGLLAMCCIHLPAQCSSLAAAKQLVTTSGGCLISLGVVDGRRGAPEAAPLPPASHHRHTRLMHLTHLALRGGRRGTISTGMNASSSMLPARKRERPADDTEAKKRVVPSATGKRKRVACKVPKSGRAKEEGIEPGPSGGATGRRRPCSYGNGPDSARLGQDSARLVRPGTPGCYAHRNLTGTPKSHVFAHRYRTCAFVESRCRG